MSIETRMVRLLEAAAPKKVPVPALTWVSAKNKYDDEAVIAYVRSKEGDLYTLHAGNDYAPDGMKFNGKWQVSIFRDGEGRIFEKRGLASFKTAEKAIKDEVGKVIAAKRFAAAENPPTKDVDTQAALEAIKAALSGRNTSTGGILRFDELDTQHRAVFFEPQYRERLDHYGTSYSDDGEEQEGWDSEGWEADYAGPLRKEIEALLKKAGIKGASVEVGEKGHISVQL